MSNAALDVLRRPLLLRLARIAIGVVLLAAALGKIGDGTGFALQVHNYRLAPIWSENLIALIVPWIELCAGLALCVEIHGRAAGVVALLLMLVFTVAVGSAWARGLDFECGCFGKASASHIGAQKFFENIGFTILAVIASLRTRTEA